MKIEEYKKWRDENYPDLKPCIYCKYFRKMESQLWACHYIFDHNKPRGCLPDYEREKCRKFRKRED